MESEKRVVCVTGGTGFIASWLIMKLLELGYSIRTTVRPDPDHKKRDLSFLTNLPGASERLEIYTADLTDPDSFNAPIEGCTGVFHVATPLDFEDREPEPVVTKRTIDGALGILEACLKSKTVKRVLYTSSASAVMFNGEEIDLMDESCWSDPDFVRSFVKFRASYIISKTLTEKAVLEFAEEKGLDLVTVIPTIVIGPFICPNLPGSVRTSLAMIFGDPLGYNTMVDVCMVHVNDVARAHIFLFEYPDAKGRYVCSSHRLTVQQVSDFLSAKYPQYPIPTANFIRESKSFKKPGISSKKLLDTGFEYKYGLDEMYDEAIQCCKEKGFL